MQSSLVTKRDYLIISLIGASFGLFSIPILNNIQLPYLPLNMLVYLALIVFFVIFANIALLVAAYLGDRIPVILQFAKFAAVGAFNTFFDWGIMNLLIVATGVATGVGYSSFKGLSFLFATVSSYFWNKHWTFAQKDQAAHNDKEVSSFILVSLIGLVINITLASLIVYFFSSPAIDEKRVANIGAALATIVSLAWNFLGYKFIVFKK